MSEQDEWYKEAKDVWKEQAKKPRAVMSKKKVQASWHDINGELDEVVIPLGHSVMKVLLKAVLM